MRRSESMVMENKLPLPLFFTCFFLLVPFVACAPSVPVKLNAEDGLVEISNGFLKLSLTRPGGDIAGISYNGADNLLEYRTDKKRGYWDISWKKPRTSIGADGWDLVGSEYKVIVQTEMQVEVSFITMWKTSEEDAPPLTVDKRFVMLQGSSGFYSYAISEHLLGWPDIDLYETRLVFKLNKDMFNFMAISDDRQRFMPNADDRLPGRAQPLAFREAVRLTNPANPIFKGEVDDKYQYAMDNKDNKLHGWIAPKSCIGFWIITPSIEFKTGGPLKQDLTSHTGPTAISMFMSLHYTGNDIALKLRNGEHWKKVFGPVFIYLNSNQGNPNATMLWADAKSKMEAEVRSWPYNYPASDDYLKADQRGSVDGKLLVTDRLANVENQPAKNAHVGLALRGEAGSWQTESRGYQFWTVTDNDGFFSIKNVIPGIYNLYGWVPGFVGDYRFTSLITITSGDTAHLNELVYEPPRDGPTLWEIGIPDRSAAEFHVPNPDPRLVNKLYINLPGFKYKQYGLWDRYSDLYPHDDLVYTVGMSDYSKDWFYAHVNRRTDNLQRPYAPATWTIKFNLKDVVADGIYKLRVALASATSPTLHVWINTRNGVPQFTTGHLSAENNVVARHGIHGMHWLFVGDIPGSNFVRGENVMFLTQQDGVGPFTGLMYDYLRLEGPHKSE